MPHVLVELQGEQALVDVEQGELGIVSPGALKAQEYDQLVRDLVGFMVYVGEPAKLVRYSMGVKVIIFLVIFTFAAWLLKREVWRDIH